MTNEQLFGLASAAVLPGWLALATAPFWRRRSIAIARWIGALLAGFYLTLLVTGLAGAGPPAGAGFTSLEGVRLLMTSEAALLAGWVHYLAFDLWVGSWMVGDAGNHRVPHWAVLPCLLLTFLAGPTGLLLYLLLRLRWRGERGRA
ncbi:ABA4-like family protein [Polymorphobacter sp.]|uniref:ABA4-like family protein n=1 Tax=Polymorphobacter sp. TaxID=1909290 RepID=UPI003F72D47F